MNDYLRKVVDGAYDHKVVVGLAVVAIVLFLAYSLLG
jgi:hypothetical protein